MSRSAITQSGKGSRQQRDPWVLNRGTLLLGMIVLPVAGLFLYVGPAWPGVLDHLATDGAILLLWLAAAFGLGSVAWKAGGMVRMADPTCVGRTSSALLGVTMLALGMGILSLLLLGLGLVGALNAIVAWGLMIVGCALGLIAHWPTLRRMDSVMVRSWLSAPLGWGWLGLLATPFLAQALVGVMTPAGMLWTPGEPHGYDVVEYHLQVPREWFELRRIVPLHHNVFSYFPFNVDMHYLLAMHLRGGPWAGMYLAQMMHLAFMALAVLAVYGLLQSFIAKGGNARASASAIIATLALCTVPWITQLAAIAYDEGGLLLFGTLAIGWALLAMESQEMLRRFALAGAMAGFAAGSKLTAVPEVLVGVPVALVFNYFGSRLGAEKVRTADPTRSGIVRGLTAFVAVGFLCFSPWLVKNTIWAANPIFPEMASLLGHDGFDANQVQRWERAHQAIAAQKPVLERVKTFGREIIFGWQFGYLILPLGVAGMVVSIVIASRRRMAIALGLLLVLLALFWLFFTHLQGRFFILAAPIAALLAGQLPWGRGAIAGVLLVAIAAGAAWFNVNQRLRVMLYGSTAENRPGLIQPAGTFQPIGSDDLSWLLPEGIDAAKLPKEVTVYLIGNARAFYYPIPISQLRYRTVFDVPDPAGQELIPAYMGKKEIDAGDWLVIDPSELKRFSATYQPFPAIPKEIAKHPGAYVEKH